MTCPCEWLKLVGDPRTICHAPFPKRSTVADDAEIQTTWKCMEISSIKLRKTSMTPYAMDRDGGSGFASSQSQIK